MPYSMTAHLQNAPDLARAIGLIRATGTKYVRLSAAQYEVIGRGRQGMYEALLKAGIQPVPICTSQRCATMTDAQWKTYSRLFARTLLEPIEWVAVGNEWNTYDFWGGIPDVAKAIERYCIAEAEIRSVWPHIKVLGPAVTNETKSDGKRKISAAAFNKAFMKWSSRIDGWPFHTYDTDWRFKTTLKANIQYVRKNAMYPAVMITETGSLHDPVGWCKVVEGWRTDPVLCSIPRENIAFYCGIGHTVPGQEGFNMIYRNLTGPYYDAFRRLNSLKAKAVVE